MINGSFEHELQLTPEESEIRQAFSAAISDYVLKGEPVSGEVITRVVANPLSADNILEIASERIPRPFPEDKIPEITERARKIGAFVGVIRAAFDHSRAIEVTTSVPLRPVPVEDNEQDWLGMGSSELGPEARYGIPGISGQVMGSLGARNR